MSRAEELRALAAAYDGVEQAEQDYETALEAFRAAPDDETAKAAYRAAGEALRAARADTRSGPVLAAAGEPGSATVAVPAVGSASTNSQEG